MATVNTPRLGIPYPDENSTPDVPRDMKLLAVFIDGIIMEIQVGPLSSEPPSSSSVPGVPGRAMIVTDQTLTGPRLDVDTGTGWFTAGPAPVDAAASIPSSRTLGQGAQQACAGNDPRLVGGAQATGDVSGPYPGPIQVNTWGNQTKAQVVAGSPPQSHEASHLIGGTDPIVGLTDGNVAPANKDGAVGTPSMRTLGTGAQQAMPGNDPRVVGGGIAQPGDLFISAAAARTGCLLCDGSAVNRITYAALFSAIGTVYGSGDGSSTFNLPNFAGRTMVGSGGGYARGGYGGEASHSLANNEMPGHNHTGADTSVDINHLHGISVGDPGHAHTSYDNVANSSKVVVWTSGSQGSYWIAPGTGSTANGTSVSGTGVSASSGWMDRNNPHDHGIYVDGGDKANLGSVAGHNNMQPYTVVNVFIKT